MFLNKLYLSRLTLNPRSKEARRDLANPYDLHRTLTRAFALNEETAPARFLWRLETATNWQQPQLLVQSQTAGHWDPLRNLPYYLQGEVQQKIFMPEQWLEDERIYRFRLQANPTINHDGKRRGLYSEDEQLAWLIRKGERHGFTPTQMMVSHSAMQYSYKGTNCLSVMTVVFDGYLRVSNSLMLLAALQEGIGSAKSLGCGLLSLGKP